MAPDDPPGRYGRSGGSVTRKSARSSRPKDATGSQRELYLWRERARPLHYNTRKHKGLRVFRFWAYSCRTM